MAAFVAVTVVATVIVSSAGVGVVSLAFSGAFVPLQWAVPVSVVLAPAVPAAVSAAVALVLHPRGHLVYASCAGGGAARVAVAAAVAAAIAAPVAAAAPVPVSAPISAAVSAPVSAALALAAIVVAVISTPIPVSSPVVSATAPRARPRIVAHYSALLHALAL